MEPECQVTVGEVQACFAALSRSPCSSTFFFDEACSGVTSFDCLVTMMQGTALTMGGAGSGAR